MTHRPAAAIVLTTIVDQHDPLSLGLAITTTWPFASIARADQNAAAQAERGRAAEVITACHDHGQPIVRAREFGGRWDGLCGTCVTEDDARQSRLRRIRRYADR